MVTAVKDADVKELTKLIKEQAGKEALAGLDPKAFCGIWPKVKDGLEMLRKLLELIPGFGFWVKRAIEMVIAAGDADFKAFCQA